MIKSSRSLPSIVELRVIRDQHSLLSCGLKTSVRNFEIISRISVHLRKNSLELTFFFAS